MIVIGRRMVEIPCVPMLQPDDGIYYRRWDVPSPAGVVLLAHGFGEHVDLYDRFAFALAARDIETWGIDLPGHGRSLGPRGVVPVDRAVAALLNLRELIGSLHPAPTLTAVGHSLGALLLGLAAVRNAHRFDRLLLSAPPLDGVGALLSQPLPATSTDPFYLDLLATDPFAFDLAAGLTELETTIDAVLPELTAGLTAISTPVGLISGSLDPFLEPAANQRWGRTMRRGSSIVVAGSRHDVINDSRHREVEAAIATFILTGSFTAGTT